MNHNSLGLNYFYFALVTGLSGTALATVIRVEMGYPGSPFLAGDSLRYLQVITGHALIMIFFVVVPVFFGAFANFFIPYHVGSKDVAFPSLNSLGFWMQPCGFVLIANVGFLRQQYWSYYDYLSFFENYAASDDALVNYVNNIITPFDAEGSIFSNAVFGFIADFYNVYLLSDAVWYLIKEMTKLSSKKKYISNCSSVTMTVTGWTFITPFSSNLSFSGVGVQDVLIVGVIYAGLSTTISIVNLLVTSRTLGIFGLNNSKVLLPFMSISLFLMLRTLALITPVLGAAMIMLILDRHWHTAFFDFTYGGDAVLFQHLFWFFGHPEVYVLIVPAFGIINEILPASAMRSVAANHHMVWAIYVMTYMGFLVWGHHMYLIGLDHSSSSLYSTITIMISLPATINVINWVLSIVNTTVIVDVPFVFAIFFIFFFLVSGITGMWLSHVSLNISMHDTFYVIAHFHLMLSGAAVTSIFGGTYYYFHVLFGVKYNRVLAYLHAIYYFSGQWLTFIPMFWLGFSGMPRRVHDYPSIFVGWHSLASVGHMVTLLGIVIFYTLLFDAHTQKNIFITSNFNIPRFNNSIMFYTFNIISTQFNTNVFSILPTYRVYALLTVHPERTEL